MVNEHFNMARTLHEEQSKFNLPLTRTYSPSSTQGIALATQSKGSSSFSLKWIRDHIHLRYVWIGCLYLVFGVFFIFWHVFVRHAVTVHALFNEQ